MDTPQIIGLVVTQTVGVVGVVMGAYIKILGSLASQSERIKVLEVTLDSFGHKVARRLHSPHDPYGIDYILDKYLDRNYELSNDEWKELLQRCREIEEREDIDKEQRFLAGMLEAVCMHKLFIPPPTRKNQVINQNKI